MILLAEQNNITRRNTKQRALILEIVRSRCDHPTADEIYSDVRRQDPKISRGTVYRNLNFLAEIGEVNHIRVPAADRFDLRTDLHYHIMCTECGAVTDVPIPYSEENDKKAEESTGFKVNRHRGVFEGICPECLKAQWA